MRNEKNPDASRMVFPGMLDGVGINPMVAKRFGIQNESQLLDMASTGRELLREYNVALLCAGIAMSRAEIKTKNRIDLRGLCTYEKYKGKADEKNRIPDIDGKRLTSEFLYSNYWYCYIPCFSEGAMQLNTDRYVYWKVAKVDTTEGAMDVFICDYNRIGSVWQMGVSTDVHYQFWDADKVRERYTVDTVRYVTVSGGVNVQLDNCREYSKIYRLLPMDSFSWSEKEREIWNKFIANAETDEKQNLSLKGSNSCYELSKIFTHFVMLSNQELWLNKPKAVRSGRNVSGETRKTEVGDEKEIKRIVRTVGGIKMTSQKPPRLPSANSIVHYKTAVWTARGGVRRMKSGKLVPFKESVRHRKCLQKTGDQAPQTTILLRGTTQK